MSEEIKKPSNPRMQEFVSLRDEFAKSAMQAFIALQPQYGYTNEQISQMAYDQSDLMLKQREL